MNNIAVLYKNIKFGKKNGVTDYLEGEVEINFIPNLNYFKDSFTLFISKDKETIKAPIIITGTSPPYKEKVFIEFQATRVFKVI